MLNAKQIELIQDSFAKLVPRATILAQDFYARLFELRPDFQELFPHNMDDQRSKLVVALATIVQNLHKLDAAIEDVRNLGKRHVGYGVADRDYEPVGAALIYALHKNLDGIWDDELQVAWIVAFQSVSGAMIEAANEVRAA